MAFILILASMNNFVQTYVCSFQISIQNNSPPPELELHLLLQLVLGSKCWVCLTVTWKSGQQVMFWFVLICFFGLSRCLIMAFLIKTRVSIKEPFIRLIILNSVLFHSWKTCLLTLKGTMKLREPMELLSELEAEWFVHLQASSWEVSL